jgi:hypothetical protein
VVAQLRSETRPSLSPGESGRWTLRPVRSVPVQCYACAQQSLSPVLLRAFLCYGNAKPVGLITHSTRHNTGKLNSGMDSFFFTPPPVFTSHRLTSHFVTAFRNCSYQSARPSRDLRHSKHAEVIVLRPGHECFPCQYHSI